MGNISGMFSFAFWVIRTLKCEAVNFFKFQSVGVPARLFKYLVAHAEHDVTRFASCVNHVIMMSPAFAFHLCHVGMRWHDVISVRIVGTPHHYCSYRMGMT